MGLIRLEQAQPGMELAADAKDRNGQLLAKAGSELSDKELRLFKMWGVVEVDVVSSNNLVEEEDCGAQDLVVEPQHHAAARNLFRHCELDHPVVALLLDECARRIAGGGSHGAEH
jgi:hypothetical protein